ncbi:hypothetical protein RB195_018149 [Necator americanus]|uniref:FAS1 domain-containing protein n=2 Tax=Necator americanus TaxID=51031 RepID=A0ABR1CAT5_NECAM
MSLLSHRCNTSRSTSSPSDLLRRKSRHTRHKATVNINEVLSDGTTTKLPWTLFLGPIPECHEEDDGYTTGFCYGHHRGSPTRSRVSGSSVEMGTTPSLKEIKRSCRVSIRQSLLLCLPDQLGCLLVFEGGQPSRQSQPNQHQRMVALCCFCQNVVETGALTENVVFRLRIPRLNKRKKNVTIDHLNKPKCVNLISKSVQMFLPHLLLCLLLTGSARAKCSICSLFSDYYDDVPLIRTAEGSHDSAERVQQRAYHSDSSAQEAARSFGRFSDLTSSLFGNLFNLLSERTGHVASDDGSSPLKGRGRLVPTVEKAGKESKEKVADQIFNIFDTIGSGIIQMTHLEGPHICTRESTKKWPADGSSLRSEKRCERFRDANKCVDRRTDSKATIETTRVEECCEGYETKDIFRHGCPIESSPITLEDALQNLNSSLWTLAKGVKIEKELEKNSITVFVSPGSESNVSDAKSYVLNRVVPGTYRAYDWTDGTVLKTVSGGELVVSQADETFGPVKSYVNCVPLESTSVRTQNGVVHVLTGDLTPASETVVDALKSDPRFDLFVSVISGDLRDLLSSNESFTVFAPSRKVLSSLSKSLFEDIREGRGCASDFARSHIVKRSFCSSQLLHRRLSSLAGGEIDSRAQIKNGERVIQIGRARLVGKEIFAKNGVVHEIDDILFSDELLSWREHLEVHNHELAKVMEEVVKNSTEPVTIFVPPGNDTLNKELAKNHIVVGEVLEDFQRPSTLTTEAGSVMFTGYSRHTSPVWMRISVQPEQRQRGQIACSSITQESIKGCRAILQFIDKPLPVIRDNFETFLAKRSDLSKFYRLWRESSLNASMTDDKPLTAFIPSDDAFSNNDFKKLASNEKLAETFVRRHIVEEPLCNFNLRRNSGEIRIQTYGNLNGEALKPTQTDGETFIDGARVEESEILLSNGVAYVMDSIIVRSHTTTHPGASRRRVANLLDIIS